MSILERNRVNFEYKSAFTTAEMLLVLLIISFLILAIPPLIHKKFEKQIRSGNHGRYECWRDSTGDLYEFLATDKDGLVIQDDAPEDLKLKLGDKLTKVWGRNRGKGAVCTFDPQKYAPGATYFSIQAVSGGGGGDLDPKTKAIITNDSDIKEKYVGQGEDTADVKLGRNGIGVTQNDSWVDKIENDGTIDSETAEHPFTEGELGPGTAIFSYNSSLESYDQNNTTKWVAKYFPPVKGLEYGDKSADDNKVYFCGGHGSRGEASHSVFYRYKASDDTYNIDINYVEGQMGGAQKCFGMRRSNMVIDTRKEDGKFDNSKGFNFKIPHVHMLFASNLNIFNKDPKRAQDSAHWVYGQNRFISGLLLNLLDTKHFPEDPDNNDVTPLFFELKNKFNYYQGCVTENLPFRRNGRTYQIYNNDNGNFEDFYYKDTNNQTIWYYKQNSDGSFTKTHYNSGTYKNYCNFYNGASEPAPAPPDVKYPIHFTLKVRAGNAKSSNIRKPDNSFYSGYSNYTGQYVSNGRYNNIPFYFNTWYSDNYSEAEKVSPIRVGLKLLPVYYNTDKGYVFNFIGHMGDSRGEIAPLDNKQGSLFMYKNSADIYQHYSLNRNIYLEYQKDYDNNNASRQISGEKHYADEHEIMHKFLKGDQEHYIAETPDVELIVSAYNGKSLVNYNECIIKGGERGVAAPPPNDTRDWSAYNPNTRDANDNAKIKDTAKCPTMTQLSTDLDGGKRPFATLYLKAYDKGGAFRDTYATPYYGHYDAQDKSIFADTFFDTYRGKPSNHGLRKLDYRFKVIGNGFESDEDKLAYAYRMNTDASVYQVASSIFPRKIVMHYGYSYDTPAYGFAGESGLTNSLMLSNLKYKLQIDPGKAGAEAKIETEDGSTKVKEPEDGGNTIVWIKKRGDDGKCTTTNEGGDTTCRRLLAVKGGSANKGGGAGVRRVLLGEQTLGESDRDESKRGTISGFYDAGAADASMRFSTDSGFVIIQEFDKKTKLPSALYQYYLHKGNRLHQQPGTGGDGGYSFINNNAGTISIWSSSNSDDCTNYGKSQGNHCKHTNLTADTLKKHSGTADNWTSQETEDGVKKYNYTYENSIKEDTEKTNYKCKTYADYKDNNNNENTGAARFADGYCLPTSGVAGAVVIVW